MALRKLVKISAGLLLLFAVVVGLTSINHPIILKWVTGSARRIGKPCQARVYTNGQINNGISVFYVDRYWGSSERANNYLISWPGLDSVGIITFFNINLNEKWIGKPAGSPKSDYDFIAGHLFQSETGGHFSPFQDDIKGFSFDPKLSFDGRQIKFNMPPNKLKVDSIRIELK